MTQTSHTHAFRLLALSAALASCGPFDPTAPPFQVERPLTVSVSPSSVTLAPLAQQTFAASSAGAGAFNVAWSVLEGAAGGTITPSGLYTAPSGTGTFTVVARETTSGVKGQATVRVTTGGGGTSTGRFASMIAPNEGETFTAPATLRLVAAGRDPNIETNNPAPGLGGNAQRVQFFVDDTMVLEVAGANAEFWIFKGFVGNVAAGTHTVWARAIYINPALTLDSERVTIEVVAPSYGQTIDLTSDLALSGASYSLSGTAGSRVRVNGNGFRMVSSGATAITLRYVDFFDMGNRSDTTAPGVDLNTSGRIDLENCTFDNSNPVRLTLTGSAPASVRGNTFRSNMRQPIGQYPASGAGGSYAAVLLQGSSTGAKAFAGNNVGAGWVQLQGSATGWVVGGDTDADSNVLIGPRVGIYADGSTSSAQIRRNYSHHVYAGGWSQGSNFELGGVTSHVVEHNLVAGSSWPVRGVGGQFRYNLVVEAGHQWLWADSNGGRIHHNVFVGGDADIAGVYVLYDRTGIKIENNTFDGLGRSSVVAAVKQTAGSASLTSNAFVNVPPTPVSLAGGSLAADYNLFWSSGSPAYSDNRAPSHDVRANPLFTNPPSSSYGWSDRAMWQRTQSVSSLLREYRTRYTPGSGSPAIDAGDPAGGAGNDIGAVGAGTANASDQFGKLP